MKRAFVKQFHWFGGGGAIVESVLSETKALAREEATTVLVSRYLRYLLGEVPPLSVDRSYMDGRGTS